MKIIYITEVEDCTEEIIKLFSENYIHDKNDINVFQSYELANGFIKYELFENQKHIDFIFIDIITLEFLTKSSYFIKDIRESPEFYSSLNFQFKSIPVVLFKKNFLSNNYRPFTIYEENVYSENLHLESNFNYSLFDGVLIKSKELIKIPLYDNELSRSIDTWLDNLNSDLDYLNIDHKGVVSLNIDHLLKSLDRLKILSSVFYKNAKRLDYIWINKGFVQDRELDVILSLLKKYDDNPMYKNEKEIHEALKNADYLLKGENFSKSIYEKHFYYNSSRRYVESDFINIKHMYSFSQNEIFEVKLPSERFTSLRNNDALLRSAKKYFEQIGVKYNKYFHDTVFLSEMIEKFKQEGVNDFELNFNLTLLMGRDKFREENLELIDKHLIFGSKQINLVTYDTLLDKYQLMYNRINRFGLR